MTKIRAEYQYTAEQKEKIHCLAVECGLHELTARILWSRGVNTSEKVKRFLAPSKKHFLSPFLMSGMRELVEAIDGVKAIGGTVGIFGDYDADGIGAAAILYMALCRYGVRCVVHIPERSEGYGMSVTALEQMIAESAPALIVTVDCGVSNREEVEYIRSRGIRVIVTDHHELPEELPNCTIINPKIADAYPYDNLCGAGVAFKIACALLGEKAYALLDITAISTVADSVPLTGENRDIVYEGVKLINTRPREAICCLLAGKKEAITAQTLAFTLAPRINAAGRMGDANSALRLFISQDRTEIYDLSCKLGEFNLERQQVCDEVYRSAKDKIASEGAYGNVIMLYDESWNTGIVGIVAARIAEEFNRPAILFVKNGAFLKGSARTIENVNIYEALKACSAHIAEFGGHAQAAGVNVQEDHFIPLRNALDEYIGKNYTNADFEPTLSVCEEADGPFDLALANELEQLEPYGVGNKKPLFSLSAEKVSAKPLKDGSPHLVLKTDTVEMVWFGGERMLPLLISDVRKVLVFECSISRFRGTQSVRGIVRDIVCCGEAGSLTPLYFFRNNLLRMQGKGVEVDAERDTIAGIRSRIAEARARCKFGLALLCSEGIPSAFSDCVAGLEMDLFRPSAQNVGNVVVVSPEVDTDLRLYREIIWLDSPADWNIPSLAGKKVVVNGEICGYNTIAELDVSRETMGEIYRTVRSGLPGEDSVTAAAALSCGFSQRQIIFALEVFRELGLVRFAHGAMTVAHGKKTELHRSAIYKAVCALKEGK